MDERGRRRRCHVVGQGEGEHAREVAWLARTVDAGVVAIGVVRVVGGTVAAHQRGAAIERATQVGDVLGVPP